MALEIAKRVTIALYLKALLRKQEAQTAALTRIADALDLLLKYELLKTGTPLSALKEATELQAMEDEVKSAGASSRGKAPAAMDLLTQTPEEIERLEAAYAHAERRLGRDRVPSSLDLYAEAALLSPDNPEETP